MSASTPLTIETVEAVRLGRAFPWPDVTPIVDAVRDRGAEAVVEFTRRFDHVDLDPGELVWRCDGRPVGDLDPALRAAIDRAFAAIEHFHTATRPHDLTVPGADPAVTLEERWTPLQRVGLYVPRGRFPLLSSLLMTGIPARVAGVPELVVALGAVRPAGLEPAWRYVLQRLGVGTVLAAGGAQAVAALAYGLPGRLDAVDLIAGPGSAWVTAAKAEVYRRGLVGVDLLAGPSEVAVVAGPSAPVRWAVLDTLAQAEHAPDALGFLVSWDRPWLERALAELEALAREREGLGPVRVLLARDPAEAVAFVNRLAPEHLGLLGEAEILAPQVTTAGAVFVGPYAGQAFGDYVAGPSHVLPTGGTGRFAAGLSTRTFLHRTSVIRVPERPRAETLEAGAELARLEGLLFHARALTERLDSPR
ncbi:Histidinol dehydrogenase [Candidatus Hydrogenisulfobacillus filiaventi]|uniref:Histidinol dehydrogenase n=1 Tax=Candidatus Hydrogenisulfobacillus filiaventi TaxID=2707344 RepID=A0A6F8ZEQ5_9FIRM|nr:Histidinol dehydrogenase [Candidatus Hydrogenisulfobacillus filiaventi]